MKNGNLKLERISRKCSGYFVTWAFELSRRERYTSVRHALILVSLASVLVTLSGCAGDRSTANAPANSSKVDGSIYLLGSEPEGATGVVKIREEAKDQDDVVIVGRIGGSANPWIDGRAAFSIVDVSLKSCAEIGSDNCPKPWDYC